MTAEAENEEYLTVHAVARRLSLSPMTIYRLVERGELTSYRFGRTIRITVAAVVEYERNSVYVPEQQEGTDVATQINA